MQTARRRTSRRAPAPRVLVLLAGAALALVTPSAPHALAQGAPAQPPPALPPAEALDPLAVLLASDRPAGERVAAAAALLREGRLQPLIDALAPDRPADLAPLIATAIATTPPRRNGALLADPPEPLLEPIVRALRRAAPEARPALAAALAVYRTRASARALVEALDAPSPEPIVDALARLSGRDDIGPDPARWREWWTQAERLTEGDWRNQLVRAHADRAFRIAAQSGDLVRQLAQAKNDLYAATPTEGRAARLIELISSDRPELSLMGFELANRELLNARALPESVAEAAFRRLVDPDPSVRIAATRLAGNIGIPDSGRLLAALQRESDPAVLVAMLAVAARRPTPELAAAIAPRLSAPPPVADAASDALASAAESGALSSPEAREACLKALRAAPPERLTTPQAKLLATIGTCEDRAALLAALPAAEPAARAQIAETLGAWLDAADFLIAGAPEDASLFPGAARAVINFRTTADALAQLDAWPAPSQERKAASRARLLEVMPPEEVLVAALRAPTPADRSALLTRPAEMAAAGLVQPPAVARAILLSAADARLALDDAPGCLAWLARLSDVRGEASTLEAEQLRTLALIRANRLTDPALDLAPVSDWMRGLRLVAERQADLAPAVRDRILTRFGGRLSAAEEQELRAVPPALPDGQRAPEQPRPEPPPPGPPSGL